MGQLDYQNSGNKFRNVFPPQALAKGSNDGRYRIPVPLDQQTRGAVQSEVDVCMVSRIVTPMSGMQPQDLRPRCWCVLPLNKYAFQAVSTSNAVFNLV